MEKEKKLQEFTTKEIVEELKGVNGVDLEKRIVELENRVAELEKVVQPDHIASEFAKKLEEAFINACKAIKSERQG